MGLPKIDVHALTPAERLALLDRIWDSFTQDPESLLLSEAQRVELDRRMRATDAGRMPTESWEDVQKQLRARNRQRG